MAETSEYALELLRDGADYTLYRGMDRGDRTPILAMVVGADQSSIESFRRLEHEYSLAAMLDPGWAVQPLALTRLHGQAALILKDPGGEPMDQVIARHKTDPLDLAAFLRIAIGLAAALGQAHGQGLIHKDIKPANALVDDAGHVWLTGFGIASRLPRERQPPGAPEWIAGTLAYMAPEQTGRMNRSIDARSDLYSLGVTLYEMSTGTPPFTASEPMEWVHSQIARQPAPPRERAPSLPEPVSAIIMKLLAKTAEERFQTAAGLERDLRRCLREWEAHGRIENFLPGLHDKPDRLLIPEKLYGRAAELRTLLAAFERVVGGGGPELVLVSGYSGVGKSSLVNELHKSLVPPRGHFASGKFDQHKQDIPYATVAQALQSLIRPILAKDERELGRWRAALQAALGPNGQLMVDLVPELKLIIGEQQAVPELPPQASRTRFQLVFRRFIGAFTKDHPLALFFDDLQWLDLATLDLMEDLLTHPDVANLLLIGAYRDNEVAPTHPLMRKLKAMSDGGARLQTIVLAPLTRRDLQELVEESLGCGSADARQLARLVEEKTGGNSFFAVQFLLSLFEEELLRFDQVSARWLWDVNAIHATGYSDNVVDLMVGKLRRLAPKTRKALRELACFGANAKFETLSAIYGGSILETHADLLEAVQSGLIFQFETAYGFLHDRVQEAAYSLIAPDLRAETHLRIGLLLASRTSPDTLEENIFEIVNQLNRGSSLASSIAEHDRIAELNLIAGRRAKSATAYTSALTYLHAGRGLLTKEVWKRNYDLVFSLETLIAECELHAANMGAAESRLTLLAKLARGRHDFAVITRLRITLYTTLDRSGRAIDVFLDYLRRNGADWSRRPTRGQVLLEYDRIWSLVGGRRIEDLSDLPLLDDPDVLDMLDVFTEIVHPAMFFDERLATLVVCRMVNLCLEHGNCDAACFGYVWFGMFAGPRFNNYKDGRRFGRLGYDLVERRGLTRYQARTYISFGTLITWARHATEGRELVRRAFDVAVRTGDLTFSAYSWHELITNYLVVGDPLSEVQSEAEKGLDFVRNAGFGLVAENCAAQLGLIRTLRGLTPTFGCLDADDYNERDTERRLASNSALVLAEFFYWTRKLQARYFAGDHTSAVEASRRAHKLLWPAASQVETGDFRFYAALAHAGAYNSASLKEKRKHFAALSDHHRQLEIWAIHCAANFETKAQLVGAEIARIEGRTPDAEQLYEAAIRSAHDNGFPHCEAVANECAAQFYASRDLAKIAWMYLRDARDGYLRWGAAGKVEQLDARYSGLGQERPLAPRAVIGEPAQRLDIETVIKASQALSGETALPQLIERLMQMTMQNAGADRGLLILPHQGDYRIEAEASADGDLVARRSGTLDHSAVPESIIRYAIRTQERVTLDDAGKPNLFSEDPYLSLRRPRSVLCLPLIRQGSLGGLLYLENTLAAGAFTPDRVMVLELLASQAAISLENAALYTDLQLQVGVLRHLPVSAWTLDTDGTPDFVNQVWLEFSGQTLDFIRSHPEAWMTAVHPEDRETATKTFWDGVRSGRGFAFETRSLRARDGTYRWHLQQAAVLRDAEGRARKFVGTTTDIDDQKRAEETLRQTQADLAHVARVATLNAMTASIAHEVNQPLSGILTNASTSLRMLAADPPNLAGAAETARRTIRDANRAAEVIRRLRAMFSTKAPTMERVDLNDAAREVIALSAAELKATGAIVETDLAHDLPAVRADRVQLQQVILNLLLNAADAMAEVDNRARKILLQTRLHDGADVELAVRDSGVGVDPHTVEKLFEAFHTTKAKGMGVGLSICRSIVESHGGRLWAAPNDGPGATFSFRLPLTPWEQAEPSA